MTHKSLDPTGRFSDRVANYVRYRPGYPDELVRKLAEISGLTADSVVADVGSGTGISTEIFLRLGCQVFAVEPNAEMRHAAEARLSGNPRFHSVTATAEQTTLADASVDLIAAGQAFHWFEAEPTRAEFARILRPGGHVCVFWNRRYDDTPFGSDYEQLLRQYGTDYEQINHKNVDAGVLERFFGRDYQRYVFANEQTFDHEGLTGRVLSSSYAPPPGHPDHEPMLAAIDILFNTHEQNGRVCFQYETELFIGRVGNDQETAAIAGPDPRP